MKQILQSLKDGCTEVAEVPVPKVSSGSLLIKTSKTLVSAGTERMLVEFGKAGWIERARKQPDKVKMVLEKIQTDGLQPTIEKVFNHLDKPLPLGYCNVGQIAEIGSGNGKLLFRLDKENMISYGAGYEVSRSRCLFSEKFKKSINCSKVDIFNQDFLSLKLAENKFDIIVGIDVVIN